jgi:hypothetical protein
MYGGRPKQGKLPARTLAPVPSNRACRAGAVTGMLAGEVIGGVAATAHGSQYSTRDVDILFPPSRVNCERLSQTVFALHAELYAPPSAHVGRRPWQIEAAQAARRIDTASLQFWTGCPSAQP